MKKKADVKVKPKPPVEARIDAGQFEDVQALSSKIGVTEGEFIGWAIHTCIEHYEGGRLKQLLK